MQTGLVDPVPTWNGRSTLLTMSTILDERDDVFHLFLLQRVQSVLCSIRDDSAERKISFSSPLEFDIMDLTPCVWLMSAWAVYMVCSATNINLEKVNDVCMDRSPNKPPYTHRPIFYPGWVKKHQHTLHCGWQQMAAAISILFDWRHLLTDVPWPGDPSEDPKKDVKEYEHGVITTKAHIQKAWLMYDCLSMSGDRRKARVVSHYVAPMFLALSSNDWRVMLEKTQGPESDLLRHIMQESSRGRSRDQVAVFTDLSRGFKVCIADIRLDEDEVFYPTRVNMKRCLEDVQAIRVDRTCQFEKHKNATSTATLQQHRAVLSAVMGLTELPSIICLMLCGLVKHDEMTVEMMLTRISHMIQTEKCRSVAWRQAKECLLHEWNAVDTMSDTNLVRTIRYLLY
jgi:hypothetical protein